MKAATDGSYQVEAREALLWPLLWFFVSAVTAWLFYDRLAYTWIGMLFFPLVFKKMKKRCLEQYRRRMRLEFKDMMLSIYSSLSTGTSVEESVRRAYRDLSVNFGEKARMVRELEMVCQKLKRNISIDQCLRELSKRCHNVDIDNFVQVILMGKRRGGNLAGLVRDSVDQIQRRIETSYEIEGMIGAKKNEFLFMCMVPSGIILYMKLFSREFMQVLYGNLLGNICMTLCLGVYVSAIFLGLHLLKIRNM